ncbi:hypothetical protein PMAYCL1PPCAC_25215 [Pristionchus mayeri]|uniref:BTB domain-containing protein n=1 Tax=Pristionchus mayeri TaxID=1317129 RepID=A0AAN5I8I0_9BILA|nr:hypothetical protein PMAYCL1PPCAC_25215 [Pristionchus mayeri]
MSSPRKKAKDGQLMAPQTDAASSGFIRFNGYSGTIREKGQFSDEVEVLGSRWKLLVKKSESSKMEIFIVRRTFDTRFWSVEVSAKFKLLGQGKDGDREFKMKERFHKGKTRAGVEFDPKWYSDIIIEARFTLSNAIGFSSAIDFTTSVGPHHDITFMFDGEKLYACKRILAIHSPVFNAMFFGNFTEKEKKEIELKDIDRENFHVVLKTLYDPTYKMEEDMNLLESVLVLADRFDIKYVVDRVEQQLINSRKFSVAQLLLFVEQHKTFRFIKLHVRFSFHYSPIEDRPSMFEWTAEGIMEVEAIFLSNEFALMNDSHPTNTSELVDEKGNRVNPCSTNPYPIKKRFAFSLDSTNRKGMTSSLCAIKNTGHAYYDSDDEDYAEHYDQMELKLTGKIRIYLTKVTRVRENSSFDFTSHLSTSDAILVVEGKEIHVHREYLSNMSNVLRRMFENSSAMFYRCEVEGVTYQDMVEFLRWIYPSPSKNFEEGAMSRMVALAKKFNVLFIIDQIASFLRRTRCFVGLKVVLHFGYDVDIQFSRLEDNLQANQGYSCIQSDG